MSEIGAIVETADLQSFLGAEVGMDASGERLTVALALSHLGFDPDVEAERLSALPRTSAAGDLAEIIVSTPGSLWVQIPIEAGRVFRGDAGHGSDLKPATIPN